MSSAKIINIQDAKTHLSRYVDAAAAGEEIVIGKAGKPLAVLMPYKAPGKPRQLGALAGAITESADVWSPATDAEIAALMYGGEFEAGPAHAASSLLVGDDTKPFGK